MSPGSHTADTEIGDREEGFRIIRGTTGLVIPNNTVVGILSEQWHYNYHGSFEPKQRSEVTYP